MKGGQHMSNKQPNENSDANVPVLPEQETYTPDTLALVLFGREGAFKGAKSVRAHLRATYTRPIEMKNKSWILDRTVANEVFEHFLAQRVTAKVVTSDDKVTS
jgi:hypothetical protein